MNVNEVIANLALKICGREPGDYDYIHPLDHVNMGQSTNDVYPTALRIACINLVRALSDECSKLQEALQRKENEFEFVVKLGRTEMMDALPITLGQEFGAFAQAIARDRWRIYKVEERLRQINLGGTAIGTGSNANRLYTFRVIEIIRDLTGIGLAKSEYPIDLTQNNDVFVEVSGLLKSLAVNLMKISTDLRIMNSKPFSEIHLADMQAGSTIMPGKVNPVIPEMVTQVAIKVMANDSAISICAASGNFELNAFMPLIAESILESLTLLKETLKIFRTKCINTITANEECCKKHLDNSIVLLATALVPYLGYDKASEIIEKSDHNPEKVKEIVFGDIYRTTKFRYSPKKDFSFNKYIDESPHGIANNEVGVKLITPHYDIDDMTAYDLKQLSIRENNVIIKLSNDMSYLEEIEEALKIEKYLRLNSGSKSNSTVESIKERKGTEKIERRERAVLLLKENIKTAEIYINGSLMDIKEKEAENRINEGLKVLIDTVYNKFNYIKKSINSNKELVELLSNRKNEQISIDGFEFMLFLM